jgi:endonuclease YncB( thermonuclease family)
MLCQMTSRPTPHLCERNTVHGRASVTRLFLALLAMAVPSNVLAGTVAGPAQVVDGDTLQIAGQRIRLFGIDAPETAQACTRDGQKWACGKDAADHVRSMIGGAALSCSGTENDPWGRLVAVCRVGTVDLNRAIVAAGWATAFSRYSDTYLADETRARAEKLGIWSSSFIRPEEYRTAISTPPEVGGARPTNLAARRAPAPANGCLIKGNHSPKGDWIYHLPGRPYYAQTRAEAMFCSEAEAQAAGYRRSRAR